MRILIIEDEVKVAEALREGIEKEGYQIQISRTGEDGFFRSCGEPLDLIILDLMLPGRDGFEVLAALRRRGISVPVLILTARDRVDDRVRGLDGGTDDYMVKPFAFPELLARIRVLVRRGNSNPGGRIALSDLEIDVETRKVTRGGKRIELTSREFDLLSYLVRQGGSVVSREMITRDVWGEPARATPLDNVIDVHIARLRRKVDDPYPVKLIRTIRGVGFLLTGGEQ
jgi:two-component system, OmpR family, copper resistance phosphate regulon response regulator CusR